MGLNALKRHLLCFKLLKMCCNIGTLTRSNKSEYRTPPVVAPPQVIPIYWGPPSIWTFVSLHVNEILPQFDQVDYRTERKLRELICLHS